MSLMHWVPVLLPVGVAAGAVWWLTHHWKAFERWLDQNHELL